jgi:shikimate dehydrogenase
VPAKYALIGDPVAHSLSPVLHTAAFSACGIDATYELIRIAPSDLDRELDRLRSDLAGFSVTTPHKEAVFERCSGRTAEAAEAGAVNTVRIEKGRTTGHNTDGSGFVAAIADLWKLSPRGRSICIFGSGPAARAIAAALRKAGTAKLACWSRNPLTAEEIGAVPDSTPDLLVSALPSTAHVPDDVLAAVARTRYVFDLNYRAEQSPVPAEIGDHRSDGIPLLLHQGALAFEWWTAQKAPLDEMRAAISKQ